MIIRSAVLSLLLGVFMVPSLVSEASSESVYLILKLEGSQVPKALSSTVESSDYVFAVVRIGASNEVVFGGGGQIEKGRTPFDFGSSASVVGRIPEASIKSDSLVGFGKRVDQEFSTIGLPSSAPAKADIQALVVLSSRVPGTNDYPGGGGGNWPPRVIGPPKSPKSIADQVSTASLIDRRMEFPWDGGGGGNWPPKVGFLTGESSATQNAAARNAYSAYMKVLNGEREANHQSQEIAVVRIEN